MKKIFTIPIFLFLLLLTGCSVLSNSHKVQDSLESKYNHNFVYKGEIENNFVFCPEENQDILFKASLNDNGTLHDDYIREVACLELEEQIIKNIDKTNLNSCVIVGASVFDSKNKKYETNLEQYILRNPEVSFAIYIFADMNNYLEMNEYSQYGFYSTIFHRVEKTDGDIFLYLVDTDTLKEIKEYKKSHPFLEKDFRDIITDCNYMHSSYVSNVVDVSWIQHKINMTKIKNSISENSIN